MWTCNMYMTTKRLSWGEGSFYAAIEGILEEYVR